MKETLEKVTDTTLEQPVTITVDIQPQQWLQAKAQQWGILPKKRVFSLRPLYLGTLIRISRILLGIDMKLPDMQQEGGTTNLLEVNYQAIEKHSYSLAAIVALAIRNTNKGPDDRLVNFILQNFTSKEMMGVLTLVLKQMDLTSFMSSIISVKGLNVLETRQAVPAMPVSGNGVSL